VELPGRLADISVAANGRLLVLRLEEALSLKVYDVAAGEIVGEIPADDEPVRFASGRDKLVLGLWGQSAIQRWDLATCRLEAERLVLGDDAPVGLAMGADSDGPVLVVKHGGGSELVDLQTLEAMEVEIDRRVRAWKHFPSSQHRVSANGRVFCAWDYQTLVSGVNVLTVEEGRATYAATGDSVGHIRPSGDGAYLFTAIGRYRVDERPDHLGEPPGFVIPAVSGPLFIRIQAGGGSRPARFALFSSHQPQEPLAAIRGLEFAHVGDIQVLRAFDTKLQMPLAPDRRLLVLPAASQLVTVGGDLRSLEHWAFDFGRWQ
jgi:hypothetical protein